MRNCSSIICLVVLPLLAAVISGCALTTDKIELSYKTRGVREKIAGADAVKVEVNIMDNRRDRERVGRKINGFGKEKGAIVSTTDVVGLVKDAIETELSQRGFLRGRGVLVSGNLNLFYNRFKPGIDGLLNFNRE